MKLHGKHPSFFSSLSLSPSLVLAPSSYFYERLFPMQQGPAPGDWMANIDKRNFFTLFSSKLVYTPRDIIRATSSNRLDPRSRVRIIYNYTHQREREREREETVTVLWNDSINRLLFSHAERERERKKDSSRPIRITRETDGVEKGKKRRKEKRSI